MVAVDRPVAVCALCFGFVLAHSMKICVIGACIKMTASLCHINSTKDGSEEADAVKFSHNVAQAHHLFS